MTIMRSYRSMAAASQMFLRGNRVSCWGPRLVNSVECRPVVTALQQHVDGQGLPTVDTLGSRMKRYAIHAAMCAFGGLLALGVVPPYGAPQALALSESARTVELVTRRGDLQAEEIATIQLFSDNTSSVVNITNIVNARKPYSTNIFEIPLGQGSGFIWDDQGHIVTNFHVIRGSSALRVTLIDQSTYPATVVGADPSRDIAVLKLDAPKEVLKGLKHVEIGDTSTLFVGQKVFALGNPFGLDHSLSSGIISGLNRELAEDGGVRIKNAIQSDCSINPGNSGGPLLASNGKVVGINTAIADPTGKGGFNGIGFAIPIADAKGVVDQILQYGRVIRPALGITVAPPGALRQLGLEGVLILDVPHGSPADTAGMTGISRDSYGRLVLGDIIVAIDGKPVKNQGDLFDILDQLKVGQTIKIDSLKAGTQEKTYQVVLKEKQIDSRR